MLLDMMSSSLSTRIRTLNNLSVLGSLFWTKLINSNSTCVKKCQMNYLNDKVNGT